ncbi:MAG: ABC transporter [Deltaproteobacteria bacterium RIFCSPLOWO2_02_FULL_44_10]|nr:MAG: ABC transporter [Deltaproteobacteria bacterium RIFCSPHIGHO2_02_FULL_44_16]OGQ46369.1 MAG: ABC transporter [Deltaproteobacteria bacterium RIFCSPLOWO2_02_FULL_44_10]
MHLHRINAILLRQLYLLRSTSRLLPIFAWVGIDIVLWGFLTRYLNSLSIGGLNFIPLLLGAILLWDFFIRVMHGVSMSFFEDVWSRNFLNIFASPLYISEYIIGLVLTSTLTSLIALITMLVLASTIFGLSFAVYGLLILPFLLILFLFGVSLGIVGVTIVLRLGPSAEWFIWPIPMIVSPFAGVLYPVSTLPMWMQHVSSLLPPSYVFEGIRTILQGNPLPSITLFLGIALALFYIFLASLFFSFTYRRAVRSGLLARYSAESVG